MHIRSHYPWIFVTVLWLFIPPVAENVDASAARLLKGDREKRKERRESRKRNRRDKSDPASGSQQSSQSIAKQVPQGNMSFDVESNVTYCGDKVSNQRLQCLDIYVPEEGNNCPVLLWIHGGGWTKGDKGNVRDKPRAFIDDGYVFVSANYRLSPDASYEQMADDVAAAIAWVHDNIDDYKGDPNAIFMMAHSAGAHLAGLVNTDERYLKKYGLSPATINGVVLLDGAGYDIPLQMKISGPRNQKRYNSVFGPESLAQRDASPITHVSSGKDIPPILMIYVGSREASRTQSLNFAKVLNASGCKVETSAADEKSHAALNQEFGSSADRPTKTALEFLQALQR